MSVLVKIRAIRDSLTSNEAKIADFSLKSPNVIKDLSSQKLAMLVGVSQSSIVKFTQKLGYKGYPDFKFALIEAINAEADDVQLHGKITVNDDFEQLNKKLLASKHKVLIETSGLNADQSIEQAVQKIKSAKRILVSGIGASALVAKDFSYKLQKIGKMALAEASGHIQLSYVSTFSSDDLVICISESGNTSDVVAVAKLAKKRGAQVITITNYSDNQLMKSADVKLYTVAEQSSIRLSSIISRTSQEFVIDLLFIALTQASRGARKSVEESNKAVKDFVNQKD
ncbi:MurR/RpiR family transcriptional regulator [Thalassotalea mangrovi]|uniref:MurR/RpiR family transcriptional regulator n=1 Tax=Thalassotalea mangrovi TaxID=2572245 RepID=A0A4U1BBR0_9GAMM|nr:MurR/RpiR family transcriptional regulator [Thalassotalea mangrovi]TKB47459.1 MurR/RpiR family transcriptional regulator [Thalassotalea mangrovi]